jgi:hypothetical protein
MSVSDYQERGAAFTVPLGFCADIRTTSVSVGSSSAIALPESSLPSRRSVVIYNLSSVVVYVGDADVTAANGIPLAASTGSFSADIGSVVLYAIAASGTDNDIRIMEVS